MAYGDKMTQQLSREDWISAGFTALVSGGINAVRVEPIAKTLGVTKGSFYWHFDDRRAWLDAMLAEWQERGTDRVIAVIESGDGDVRARLTRLIEVAVDPTGGADAIEAELRSWAGIDEQTAAVVRAVDARRIQFVVDMLVEAGIAPDRAQTRSEALYRVMIGKFTWRRAGGPAGTATLTEELVSMMLS